MDSQDAIRLAAELPQPFTADTFTERATVDESNARVALGVLIGMGWVTHEHETATNAVVYRVTSSGYEAALTPSSLFVEMAHVVYYGFLWSAASELISRWVKRRVARRENTKAKPPPAEEIRRRSAQKALRAEEIYILCMTAVLILGWLAVDTDHSVIDTLVVVIAIYRGIEIFGVALGIVLVKETVKVARQILTVALYGVQVPLILAIVTHALTAEGFSDSSTAHPQTALDFLYLSWTNITTLGSKYAPTSDPAKALVIISGASGLILLGVFLSLAVNRIGKAA